VRGNFRNQPLAGGAGYRVCVNNVPCVGSTRQYRCEAGVSEIIAFIISE
jgi:hypothetical protein